MKLINSIKLSTLILTVGTSFFSLAGDIYDPFIVEHPEKNYSLPPALAGVKPDANRCGGDWGDSLDTPSALGRVQWALRCRPEEKPLFGISTAKMVNVEGEKVPYLDARIYYPTYGLAKWSADNAQWNITNPKGRFAPTKKATPCAESPLPETYHIVAFCVSSCYTPEQLLLFPNGDEEILTAKLQKQKKIVTLAKDATQGELRYQDSDVRQFVESLTDGNHAVRTITTKSGNKVRVTINHPLVTSDGFMRLAEQLQVGDALVKASGENDEIVDIQDELYRGKVYNVIIESMDNMENILVAQDFLSGSSRFQNEGAEYVNRRILREVMTAKAFEK